jgi:hypothetical protein
MKADVIVSIERSVYRIERGRATAEVGVGRRPRLRVRFNGGALDVSLTIDEAYRIGAELIVCADLQAQKKLTPRKRNS